METERSPGRSIRVLAGALGLIAMVLPRLPRIRPHDTVAGVIPVGHFSGGLLDGNTLLMSVLLVASAGIMTGLRPARAWESAWILGLAPTAWMVIVMMWHGRVIFGLSHWLSLPGTEWGWLCSESSWVGVSRGS